MFAATALLLLGSVFVLSAHGQGELDVPFELDHGDMKGLTIKPQNGTWSHRYFIPNYRATGTQAVADCAKMGGVLADLRSQAEMDFLQTLSARTGDIHPQWVGGALGPNKTFVWVSDRSEIGKDLWRKGQPNPKLGNCVLFKWEDGPANLSVFDCTHKKIFVCKFPLRK